MMLADATCPGGYDRDYNLHGGDLAELILRYSSSLTLEEFADHFGRNSCP